MTATLLFLPSPLDCNFLFVMCICLYLAHNSAVMLRNFHMYSKLALDLHVPSQRAEADKLRAKLQLITVFSLDLWKLSMHWGHSFRACMQVKVVVKYKAAVIMSVRSKLAYEMYVYLLYSSGSLKLQQCNTCMHN